MKKLFYFLTALCAFSVSGFAARAADTLEPEEFQDNINQTSSTDGDWATFNFHNFSIRKAIGIWDVPFIRFSYGIANPAINKAFDGDFTGVPYLSATAGYSDNGYYGLTNLSKEKESYLRYTNYSPDLGKDRKAGEFGLHGWDLSWAKRKALGWNISQNFDILLYHGSSLNWSWWNYDAPVPRSVRDYDKMEKICDGMRFGESFNGGIEFKLGNHVGILCGYEQDQIYPRLKFWKWTGSSIIEAVADGIADAFADEVIDRSKIGGPIVYFLARNAISYGIYELRKKNMNWPFKTEAPLYMDKFNVGLNFAF